MPPLSELIPAFAVLLAVPATLAVLPGLTRRSRLTKRLGQELDLVGKAPEGYMKDELREHAQRTLGQLLATGSEAYDSNQRDRWKSLVISTFAGVFAAAMVAVSLVESFESIPRGERTPATMAGLIVVSTFVVAIFFTGAFFAFRAAYRASKDVEEGYRRTAEEEVIE